MLLTAEDIARVTAALCGAATPVRTAQGDIAQMRAEGVRVERLRSGGRGQPPWAVDLATWCARRCLDVGDVLRVLGRDATDERRAA